MIGYPMSGGAELGSEYKCLCLEAARDTQTGCRGRVLPVGYIVEWEWLRLSCARGDGAMSMVGGDG